MSIDAIIQAQYQDPAKIEKPAIRLTDLMALAKKAFDRIL